ncbi:tenomodulin [Amia ocellicauda]|uniref:tenomodulin n=1 Tax=Amia ocellicauda TaxID=2972642 RepID=UPI0034640993
METNCQSSSQQTLWKDVEVAKEKKRRHRSYQLGALVAALVVLSLTLCFFTIKHFWIPGPGKVYDMQYKVMLDGVETESLMEIDPGHRIEIFRTGNGTEEVLEIHDFKNGMTGIRFAKHQRCYIRTLAKELPKISEEQSEDPDVVDEDGVDTQFEDSQVWVPVEEPIENRVFLLNSKIFEMCEHLPIHWMHPSSLKDAEFHDIEDVDEVQESTQIRVKGQRQTRDITDHLPVNDYRENGIELDNRLDERGICCQYCRRGYRFCQRYLEPLRGYMPYPYYYQGGRVICRTIMPCNWWIARMLGRV